MHDRRSEVSCENEGGEKLNIDTTVLPENVEYARKLHTCAIDYLRRSANRLADCNLVESEKWIVEYHRCNSELKVLQYKKLKSERKIKHEKRIESFEVV